AAHALALPGEHEVPGCVHPPRRAGGEEEEIVHLELRGLRRATVVEGPGEDHARGCTLADPSDNVLPARAHSHCRVGERTDCRVRIDLEAGARGRERAREPDRLRWWGAAEIMSEDSTRGPLLPSDNEPPSPVHPCCW